MDYQYGGIGGGFQQGLHVAARSAVAEGEWEQQAALPAAAADVVGPAARGAL